MTVLATANRLNTCVGCSKRRNTSDSAARIHFLGAAGSVTGSRFLIEYASSQLLLEGEFSIEVQTPGYEETLPL